MARRSTELPHAYQRERWTTPDHDFIDVDWLRQKEPNNERPASRTPLLVMFHGLEGTSSSHYAVALAAYTQLRGWDFVVPHFRGCSGEINLAPRAYHSGDYAEVDWILRKLRTMHQGPIFAVGVSLGGNALLRWAEESGRTAADVVVAMSAVCAPVDLAAGGRALGQGFNRWVYTPMFLKTMKPKALKKLAQHPGLFDAEALSNARNLYEFDNVFTAPLHGFKNTDDYWARASAKPHLRSISIPTLLVHARNDPFVPAGSLPTQSEVGAHVTLWQPATGGHVGFTAGPPPGHLRSLPEILGPWMAKHIA